MSLRYLLRMARGGTRKVLMVGGATVVALSALYAYFVKTILAKPGAQPTPLPLSAEPHEPPASVAPNPARAAAPAAIKPEIHWEEAANRWFRLSGSVPNASVEQRVLASAWRGLEANDQRESTVAVRPECEEAPWLAGLEDLPFDLLRSARSARLSVTGEGLKAKGIVASAAELTRLETALNNAAARLGLPVALELAVEPPLRSRVTFWVGPDRTFVIGGTVGEGQAKSIVDGLRQGLPKGMRLVSDLTESRFADAPEWSGRLAGLAAIFQDHGKIEHLEVCGNKVTVEGLAESSGLRRIRSTVMQAFPSPLFEFESKIKLGARESAESRGSKSLDKPSVNDGSQFAKLVANTTIFFNRGATKVAQIKRAERSKLDRLAKAWPKGSSYVLRLSGTLEGTANLRDDQKVLTERCEAIAEYLAEEGIPKAALTVDPPPDSNKGRKGPDARLVDFRLEGSSAPVIPPVGPPSELKEVKVDDLIGKTVVYFQSKARLEPDEKKKLDQLGAALLAENIDKKLILYGFSDGRGSAEANLWMTEERCKAVRGYLVSLGVREDLMEIKPVNAPEIVEENGAAPKREAPAKLRRVEFGFAEPEPAPAAPATPPTENPPATATEGGVPAPPPSQAPTEPAPPEPPLTSASSE